MNKKTKNGRKDKSNQEQLTFDILNSKDNIIDIKEKVKYKYPVKIYDCIDKYKYVGIENSREYLFEKDWSFDQCVIDSDTGEEVESLKLPLLSEISAGSPIYMNEEYEDYFYIPRDVIKRDKDLFMLKVKGDSMIEAGIDDGDYVVIRKENNVSKKSIVAVEVDGHATLKRFDIQGNKLILIPENKKYDPIIVSVHEARIIGSALGVIKSNVI
ncbi:MAG: transcriptional repressor LexA [Peptostreptococcaceae bacterium]